MKEKEDLVAKLKIFTRSNESNMMLNNNFSTLSNRDRVGNINSPGGPAHFAANSPISNKKSPSLEQLYVELKDEYKVCRVLNEDIFRKTIVFENIYLWFM